MTVDSKRAEEREQRDALQQFVDRAIACDASGDPRQLIQNVSKLTRRWVWAQQHAVHEFLDDILASSFVDKRYRLARHAGRPNRSTIDSREPSAGEQLELPHMKELQRWRWASRDGKVERSVWKSTIGELDALDADYEARQIDMAAKRRYLFVVRAQWRAAGVESPTETVEAFYRRMGKVA